MDERDIKLVSKLVTDVQPLIDAGYSDAIPDRIEFDENITIPDIIFHKENTMNFIAYLAGPITGLSFDNCVDWREKIINLLPDEIIGMSPMRGKNYLEGLADIASSYDSDDLHELAPILSSSKGIMTRDYNDCKRSDIIIVNLLEAERISVGTIMEIAWGFAHNIPVIAIMEEKGNIHEHPMVREGINFRVNSIEQAAQIAKIVLMPVPHR